MQLTYLGNDIGAIIDAGGVGLWMYGKYTPNSAVTPDIAAFFRFMTSPEADTSDPPFTGSILQDESWEIIDDSGERRGISMPFVQVTGQISWRWRSLEKSSKPIKPRRRKR